MKHIPEVKATILLARDIPSIDDIRRGKGHADYITHLKEIYVQQMQTLSIHMIVVRHAVTLYNYIATSIILGTIHRSFQWYSHLFLPKSRHSGHFSQSTSTSRAVSRHNRTSKRKNRLLRHVICVDRHRSAHTHSCIILSPALGLETCLPRHVIDLKSPERSPTKGLTKKLDTYGANCLQKEVHSAGGIGDPAKRSIFCSKVYMFLIECLTIYT